MKQMLFLSQLPFRILLFFCLIVIFCNFSNATKLTVSPPFVNLSLGINEIYCENIKVSSDKMINIRLEDYWSEFYSKDLNFYDQEDVFYLEYPKLVQLNEEKVVRVCFRALDYGKFYGVLVLSSAENKIGVGIWLEINVEGDKSYRMSNINEPIFISNIDKLYLDQNVNKASKEVYLRNKDYSLFVLFNFIFYVSLMVFLILLKKLKKVYI